MMLRQMSTHRAKRSLALLATTAVATVGGLLAVSPAGAAGYPDALATIAVNDPYVLTDTATGTYYLYDVPDPANPTVVVRSSTDLANWSAPATAYQLADATDAWFVADPDQSASTTDTLTATPKRASAPAVTKIGDKYYMTLTLADPDSVLEAGARRAAYHNRYNTTYPEANVVLEASSPAGPFTPIDLSSVATDLALMTLDGSLYVDPDGTPFMVYAHDWWQKLDGIIEAVQLDPEDLTQAVGDQFYLFRGSDASFWKELNFGSEDPEFNAASTDMLVPYVTGSPRIIEAPGGQLVMLWTTSREGKLAQMQAVSPTGNIRGPWVQQTQLLPRDRGQGSVFLNLDGDPVVLAVADSVGTQHAEIFQAAFGEDGALQATQHLSAVDGAAPVSLEDTVPPVVYVPGPVIVETVASPVRVTFQATAYDAVDGEVEVTYSRQPGSYFSNNMTAAGVTTPVTVTATDKAGNTASASFNVIVRRPGTAVAPPAAPATTELATTFPCTMSQLGLHDPFIVADQASQTYFLYTAASRQSTTRPCGVPTASYAAGIMAYQSKDLVHWSQASVVYRVTTGADHWNASTAPWAPEVHAYNGKYYLFTTLHNNSSYTIPFTEQPDQTRYNSSSRRSTIIAVSDTATGPFTDLSPEAPVTPYDFMTLDGSLYVDPAGQPYLVYAHEWVQKMDGTVEAIPLTDDLTSAEGDPFLLWRATEVPFYADPLYGGRYDNVLQDKTLNKTQLPGYVTDGVFVVTTPNGSLLTMWTTYRDDRYIVGQAISRTGNIHGPWEQLPEVDYSDAGHSMVFKTFDGQLMMVEHSNMSEGSALGEIFEIAITDDGFVLGQHRQDIDELVGINPQDVLAPKVYPPSTRVATAAKGTAAATVDFLAMARDDADGWVDVTYSKQPGSTFPVGTTKVTVTARDAAGNVGTASFNVVVKPYPTVGAGSVTLTGSTALGGVLHANAVAPTQDSNGQDITATVTYRWLRNGTAIAGATGVDYTTVGADAGQLISVQATFSAPEADSSAAVSAEVMITATAGPNVKYEFFSLTPDLEGNGRGDILAVEASTGALYLQTTTASGDLSVKTALAASGLNGHRVYGPGDWNSDGKADVITVDVAGNMWLRAGNGAGKVAAPVQCGRGWSAYRIVPSGDLNGDKLNDLLAIDSAGKLWLYAGNGKGGFLPGRTEVGHGWTSFELYAAGDLNKDGKADILGISANGDLYAYMGKGNGQFQAAKYVGRGWGTFTLASGADLNGDGMADIVGRNDSNGTLYFYSGTGTGFGQAKKIASGW